MRVYGITDTGSGFVEMENTLEAEQAFVGGYIEVISIGNGIDLVCNDEAKINGLEPTVAWIEEGEVVDVICGNCFLCRSRDGEFISIKEEDLKFIKEKLKPIVLIIGNRIIVNED